MATSTKLAIAGTPIYGAVRCSSKWRSRNEFQRVLRWISDLHLRSAPPGAAIPADVVANIAGLSNATRIRGCGSPRSSISADRAGRERSRAGNSGRTRSHYRSRQRDRGRSNFRPDSRLGHLGRHPAQVRESPGTAHRWRAILRSMRGKAVPDACAVRPKNPPRPLLGCLSVAARASAPVLRGSPATCRHTADVLAPCSTSRPLGGPSCRSSTCSVM